MGGWGCPPQTRRENEIDPSGGGGGGATKGGGSGGGGEQTGARVVGRGGGDMGGGAAAEGGRGGRGASTARRGGGVGWGSLSPRARPPASLEVRALGECRVGGLEVGFVRDDVTPPPLDSVVTHHPDLISNLGDEAEVVAHQHQAAIPLYAARGGQGVGRWVGGIVGGWDGWDACVGGRGGARQGVCGRAPLRAAHITAAHTARARAHR